MKLGGAEAETQHEEDLTAQAALPACENFMGAPPVLISSGHLSKTHDELVSHLFKVTTWDWTRAEKTFSVYEIMCKILKVGPKSGVDCKGFAWPVGVLGSQAVYENKQCLDMKENTR